MGTKRCSKCGETKPLDGYNRDKSAKDGLQYRCRECQHAAFRQWRDANRDYNSKRSRDWREANPERRRENKRAWQQAHPEKCAVHNHRRRARKSSAVPQRWTVDHTLGDPLACWWCGRGLLGTAVHTDHVMPIRLGGPASTANEVMSCADCNCGKNAKHPLVWIAELVS